MLGRTAGNLFWTFRYLERLDNTARLLEAGVLISLSRPDDEAWRSVVTTEGLNDEFEQRYDDYNQDHVVDFMLRDPKHEDAALVVVNRARDIARSSRTVLTSEIWEAINRAWMEVTGSLGKPVRQRDLPQVLRTIHNHTQQVRGALHGTLLRNDIFDFIRLGSYVERLEATARILDVKYYLLLPSVADVGSTIDSMQWEMILRSVSAFDSFHWLNHGKIAPVGIANFLLLDRRFPRSIAYCLSNVHLHLNHLAVRYGAQQPVHSLVQRFHDYVEALTIEEVFERGLHEVVQDFIARNETIASQIETDYRFYG